MATITLDDIHESIVALRHQLELTEARLEAKIDSKPSLMSMFTGIVIVVFGMFGVVASTIATLHTIGFIR